MVSESDMILDSPDSYGIVNLGEGDGAVFRKRSFLILGTGAEDFGWGTKLFPVFCGGTNLLRTIFTG